MRFSSIKTTMIQFLYACLVTVLVMGCATGSGGGSDSTDTSLTASVGEELRNALNASSSTGRSIYRSTSLSAAQVDAIVSAATAEVTDQTSEDLSQILPLMLKGAMKGMGELSIADEESRNALHVSIAALQKAIKGREDKISRTASRTASGDLLNSMVETAMTNLNRLGLAAENLDDALGDVIDAVISNLDDAGVSGTDLEVAVKEIAEKSVQKAGAVFSDLTALNAGLKSLTENLVGALDDTGMTALDNLTTSVTETVVKNLENIENFENNISETEFESLVGEVTSSGVKGLNKLGNSIDREALAGKITSGAMKGMGELAKSNKLNVEKAIEKVSELSATALGGLDNIDADTLTSLSNILMTTIEEGIDTLSEEIFFETDLDELKEKAIKASDTGKKASGVAGASAASCSTTDNKTVLHGRGITTFLSSSVDYGNSCESESAKMTCDNGTLSFDNESLVGQSYSTACTVGSNPNSSGSILFASQYSRIDGGYQGAYTKTSEEGLVYVAAGYSGDVQNVAGNWDYGWFETVDAHIIEGQSYGKQWAHDSALEKGDTVYINVKAPKNEAVDASGTDTLVIQMGNGAEPDQINTHNVFTVTLHGGTQPNADNASWQDADTKYNWTEVCSTDQKVSSTNKFGLSTYYLKLNKFKCSSGSLVDLKEKMEEVVVKVIAGKNPKQDRSSTMNHTFPRVGFIAFVNSTAIGSTAPTANVLFASQYTPIEGASGEPYIESQEGGEVYGFSGGKFSYADYGVTHNGPGVPTAQAYGAIYQHTEAVTEADYFGWAIKGPGNASVNACGADDLVIQLGNAQASTGEYAAPNSHMVFTIELQNDSGQSCEYDLTLAESTRPGQEGANDFGLQTYYIPMSEFSGCSANAISQIAVKVVGGKDADASGSSEGNATFPVFGFIGFTGDNEAACEAVEGPDSDSELLTNGDFEAGVDSWIGNAANVDSVDGSNLNSANIETAGNAYDVNLSQVVSLVEGETYVLSFRARSDGARSLLAGIGLNADPWTNSSQEVTLSAQWQDFSLELTANGMGGDNSRVLFDMGAATGLVLIDDVSLKVPK